MGLKSGSRDAGLDDEEADEERSGEAVSDRDPSERASEATDRSATEDVPTSDTTTADESSNSEPPTENGELSGPTDESDTTDDRPSVESLPYVLRRDRVNEGRDQVPFFLREEVVDGERELRETLEATLGENVYKSDYREAAMVVAQEHPELVAAVLRRWGYDLS